MQHLYLYGNLVASKRVEYNRLLPDRQYHASSRTGDRVPRARRMDQQCPWPMGSALVDLAAAEHQDVLERDVPVARELGPRRVAQQCRRLTCRPTIEPVHLDAGSKQFPADCGIFEQLKEVRKND